jgi:hypothetical protein
MLCLLWFTEGKRAEITGKMLTSAKIGKQNGDTRIRKRGILTSLIIKKYTSIDKIWIRHERNSLFCSFTKSSGSGEYEMIVSERLGRSVSKEQYAFIYRY